MDTLRSVIERRLGWVVKTPDHLEEVVLAAAGRSSS
jgi:hypothetical protein